jgi:hypothetical protein
MTTAQRAPQIIQIYRETVNPAFAAVYKTLEEEAARYCVELDCPHPHLAMESIDAPTEVWWLNAYESEAQKERVYQGYMANHALLAALEQIAVRKEGVAEKLEEFFVHYRAEPSGRSSWPQSPRFFIVTVTRREPHPDGYVFDAGDGRTFTLQLAATQSEANAIAEKNSAGESRIFAVRPYWGMAAPEWIAADPNFWQPNPVVRKQSEQRARS